LTDAVNKKAKRRARSGRQDEVTGLRLFFFDNKERTNG
jgi:hypothetical protein